MIESLKVSAPFQKIPEACRSTGLSQYFLRKGCKDGSVPHIRSGTNLISELAIKFHLDSH